MKIRQDEMVKVIIETFYLAVSFSWVTTCSFLIHSITRKKIDLLQKNRKMKNTEVDNDSLYKHDPELY
jgi:hypothetical protein